MCANAPTVSISKGGSFEQPIVLHPSESFLSTAAHLEIESVIDTKKATPQYLPKIATGIQGFDELSHGGLPRNRISLLKGGPGSGKTVFALQSLVNAARQRKGARDLRGVRGAAAANHHRRRRLPMGSGRSPQAKAVFHGRKLIARCGPVRGIRSARHAGHAQGKEGGNRRAMDRVRRHRRVIDAAAKPEVRDSRDLPHSRLVGGKRSGCRNFHRQDRRPWFADGELRLPAVHGGLRDRVRVAPGVRGRVAPHPGHEVSRLGLCEGRVSGEFWPRRDGNRRPRTDRNPAGRLGRACLRGFRAARHDAGRRVVPREQHADHGRARHLQDDLIGQVRGGGLQAGRTHAVRELRRGRRSDRPKSHLGRNPAQALR